MNEEKMNFDMKPWERLKVRKGYVTVYQENGLCREYSLNGKLLNESSEKLTNTMRNYIILKGIKGTRLFDTEKQDFFGEYYDEVSQWSDGIIVLKKNQNYYLYNCEKSKIVQKFEMYAEYHYSLEFDGIYIDKFIVLYGGNKCGLCFLQQYPKKCIKILPIEYQEIRVIDNKVIQLFKNGNRKNYSVKMLIESKCETEECEQYDSKENYSINLFNKIKVNLGENVVLGGKFFCVLRNKKFQYYNLNGGYIGESNAVASQFVNLAGNYIETDKMIALCNDSLWNIYDYSGKLIFEKAFFRKETLDEYILFSDYYENEFFKNIMVVFSKNGDLLCEFKDYAKIKVKCNCCCMIIDSDNKAEFFKLNGEKIFDGKFEEDAVKWLNDFICVKDSKGYEVFNFEKQSKYHIEADNLDLHEYICGDIYSIKKYKNGKCGEILLEEEGYRTRVPVEYLDIERHEECILAKTENGHDVYNLDGKLIYSTR